MRYILTLIMCTLFALPAQAKDGRDSTERVLDGLGFGVATGGLALAGFYAGAAVGQANCDREGDELFGCLDEVVLGLGIGTLVGAVGGALLYDGLSDGDGSFLGAGGGLVVGIAASLGWAGLVDDDALQWGGGLVLMAAGTGLGYALFDDLDGVQPSAVALPDGRGGMRYSLGLTGAF